MLVSFQDRQNFDTHSSYVRNKFHCCNGNETYHSVGSLNKAWRGVNFAPRYHQTRLSSAKFSFRDPNTVTPTVVHRGVTKHNAERACWNNAQKPSTGSSQQPNTQRDTKNISQFKRVHFRWTDRKVEQSFTYQAKAMKDLDKDVTKYVKRDFQRKFQPLLPRDDAVGRVQQWRSFMMVKPYKNPQPFDHRGLDILDIPSTCLRTLITPDPYNTRFKTRTLTDEYKQCFTDSQKEYSTRVKDFTFNTCKTPELHYDTSLLHSIGRYSPAYSAYNAYLDRVNKTVSMD